MGTLSKIIQSIFNLVLNKVIDNAEMKCNRCKSIMETDEKYLFLLPVNFGDTHEESASYYIENALPIENEAQIPNGRRACHMYLFKCPACSNQLVSIVDFLKVRENYSIKGGDVYPYDFLRSFLNDKVPCTEPVTDEGDE